MKVQLVIFDMDGTILNTLEDLKNSLNASLAAFDFPQRTFEEVRSFVGNGIRKLVERGVPEGTAADEIDRVFDFFNQHYAVHCNDHTGPYEGIVDLIKTLRKEGYRTAVVSNKTDYAVQILCKQHFEGLFDAAIGARDGARKKPAPDSVYTALHELGIEKDAAVYVGDSEVDLETAKNAQMDCIGVAWGFRGEDALRAAGAKTVVSDMHALHEAIVR